MLGSNTVWNHPVRLDIGYGLLTMTQNQREHENEDVQFFLFSPR